MNWIIWLVVGVVVVALAYKFVLKKKPVNENADSTMDASETPATSAVSAAAEPMPAPEPEPEPEPAPAEEENKQKGY